LEDLAGSVPVPFFNGFFNGATVLVRPEEIEWKPDMKLLAISDTYIAAPIIQAGLASLADLGIEVSVRRWEHPTLIELQQANLVIEQDGPNALPLPDDVLAGVDNFDILIVQFTPVGRRLLEATTRLKLVGVLRGGTENVDLPYATARGIAVANTPGRNARAVAECTLGLILSEVRNLARSHAALKAGQWRRDYPNSAAIPELRGKTVGLVGYGNVAQLVAHYLEAFGSRIVAYDPYFQGDPRPAELVDLPTLLAQSDVVSVHARLTEETRGLLGRKELAQMKPTAVLINTARSGLIDEPALVEALSQRRIMGAALDVFDIEPLPTDHPLLKLDNVTLTPHLAGSTIDSFLQSPVQMAGQLRGFLTGQGRLPIVNGIEPRLGGSV
jgi:D-3-phosphoglycerate dehydrogenase / 2-oxoglutarate reductase